MGTAKDRQDTVQHRQNTVPAPCPLGALAEPNQPVSAMDACIYVRLPTQLRDDMRARAAEEGQTDPEWVRRRIARALAQPAPRGCRRGRRVPAPGDDLLALVHDQEAVAAIGIALRQVIADSGAGRASPDWIAARVATILAKLEELSGAMVRQIERTRT